MMKKKQPFVSILIPYFNEENKIKPTIDSLLSQTLSDIEIICIDDGSTDGTFQELTRFVEKDDRVKVITKENEGSPAKAIDFGIKYITGEYFFYSSKDDFFDVDFFEKLYSKIIVTGADAVVPNVIFDYGNEDYSKGIFGLKGNYSREISGLEAAQYCLDSFVISGNALFLAKIVKNIGCETFSYNSDEYTAKLYYLQCRKVVFCNTNFYYKQDPESYTRKWSSKMIQSLETNRRYEKMAIDYKFDLELIRKIREERISLLVELILKLDSFRSKLEEGQYLADWNSLKEEYRNIRKDVRQMDWAGISGKIKKIIYSGGFTLFVWWVRLRNK
jgi:glycosyltransferase involved in cell wall biosynthesis